MSWTYREISHRKTLKPADSQFFIWHWPTAVEGWEGNQESGKSGKIRSTTWGKWTTQATVLI